MSAVTRKLPEFKGFAVHYDPKQKPFFEAQVVEAMRKLASVDLGKQLLAAIKDAKPKVRKAAASINADARAIHFSSGVNVVITPAASINFIQSGFKADKLYGANNSVSIVGLKASSAAPHNLAGCPFHIDGGSAAMAIDPVAADNGQGCCSIMYFTNAQIMTRKGEAANPVIVLAHELIHSLHHVTGSIHKEEELVTSGIGKYADLPMTENAFRKAFGIALRVEYY